MRVHVVSTPACCEAEPWPRCWLQVLLDVARMQEAAALLLGRHDFTHLSQKAEPDPRMRVPLSPVRELRRLEVCRVEGAEFHGDAGTGCVRCGRVMVLLEADFFLYKMCRKIVGTLVQVGSGKLSPQAMMDVLAGRAAECVVAAPPSGLCLHEVFY